MSADNILVLGKWPVPNGFEYRVADVGFSQFSSTYGVWSERDGYKLITPEDAVCVVTDFCGCQVFNSREEADAEVERIQKHYWDTQFPLEYGTTTREFKETFGELVGMARGVHSRRSEPTVFERHHFCGPKKKKNRSVRGKGCHNR